MLFVEHVTDICAQLEFITQVFKEQVMASENTFFPSVVTSETNGETGSRSFVSSPAVMNFVQNELH